MTTTTPTVADEIERYLRTGDTDPYHAAWSARRFLEGAQCAGADLENALVAEVSRRATGWEPPQDANPMWPDHVRATLDDLRGRLGHGV